MVVLSPTTVHPEFVKKESLMRVKRWFALVRYYTKAARVLAIALLVVVALAAPSADAAVNCRYSTICNPWGSWARLRNSPWDPKANWVPLNYGDGIYIVCWTHGRTISGPWGMSDLWEFVNWSTQYGWTYKGFVSDTYVYTGTNGAPRAAECDSTSKANF